MNYNGLDGRKISENGSVVLMHEGMAARVEEKIEAPPVDLISINSADNDQISFTINDNGHLRDFSFGDSGAFEVLGSDKNPLKSDMVHSLMKSSQTIDRFAQVALKPSMYAEPSRFLNKFKDLAKRSGLSR